MALDTREMAELETWTVAEPRESEEQAEARRGRNVQAALADRDSDAVRIVQHEIGSGAVTTTEYTLRRADSYAIPRDLLANPGPLVTTARYRVDLTENQILAISAALDFLEAIRRPDDPEGIPGVTLGSETDGHALFAARHADLFAVRYAQDTFRELSDDVFCANGPEGVVRRIAR